MLQSKSVLKHFCIRMAFQYASSMLASGYLFTLFRFFLYIYIASCASSFFFFNFSAEKNVLLNIRMQKDINMNGWCGCSHVKSFIIIYECFINVQRKGQIKMLLTSDFINNKMNKNESVRTFHLFQ